MVLDAADPAAVRTLAALLARGGVAIIPCDTIYGIVGVDPEADARIRTLKGRGEDKPFLRLVGDASWARAADRAAALPGRLARHWPGPLTLVLPVGGRRDAGAARTRGCVAARADRRAGPAAAVDEREPRRAGRRCGG